MVIKDVGKQVASAKTYRFGGRVSVEGLSIAQLSKERCQTDIFDISADGRNPSRRSSAGQRINYSQKELLDNVDVYLRRIPKRFIYMPEAGDQIVGPETALYWLTYNTNNRTVSDARVLRFAQEMVRERWLNGGDPVIFCQPDDKTTPWIISGQARLWASWLTNKACEHTIRWETNPDVQAIVDTGKTRTSSDLFASSGFNHPTILTNAITIVRGHEEFEPPYLGATTWETVPKYPSLDLREWADENPDFIDRIDTTFNSLKQCSSMLRSHAWAGALEYLMYIYCHGSPDFHRFWEDFETGVNLDQGDPVLVLRETLYRDKALKKINKLGLLAMVIKAWNYRKKNRAIKELRWRTNGERIEPFPEIL
jgi:hypothetical protein